MNKIVINKIDQTNIDEEYLQWLNDPEVMKFSVNRFKKHNLHTQKKYINELTKDNNGIIFGIYFNELHVGVITLKNINKINKTAELSYLVGKKDLWGKGIASSAIKKCLDYGKNTLLLKTIYASCISINLASYRVLQKNKFKLINIKKKYLKFNNQFYDQLDLAIDLGQ